MGIEPEGKAEALKGLAEQALELVGHEGPYLVGNAMFLIETINEEGASTVVNINTLGRNPWMQLGILEGESRRVRTKLGHLNLVTLQQEAADDADEEDQE